MGGRSIDTSPWFTCPRVNPNACTRLICFPHAGGGPAAFHSWPARLPESLEVWAVQLPGRSARLTEAPISRLVTLAQLAADALVPALDKPVAIFGHSMGALLGFEVARHLRRYGRLPIHLFVLGCPAPHTIRNTHNIHELAESDFLAELGRLNGTPPEVLDNEDVMQLFLPILRADFAAFESYRYVHEAPLEHPITAFGGTDDSEVSSEELVAWKQQTTAAFAVAMIAGGHFPHAFSQALMLQKVADILSEDPCRSRGE